MKNHKKTKELGITLIALVVTIIVLLILAGISIMMLTGENGIINRAGEAKDNKQESQLIEEAKMDIMSFQTLQLTDVMSESDLEGILSPKFGTITGEGESILDKNLITTDGKFTIPVRKIYDGILKEDGSGIDIATLQTETTKPYLPSGFRVSSKVGEQTVENGLVITDGTNEFVWVEVPITGGSTGVYKTAGLGITTFSDTDYKKIAKDLAVYSGSTLSNNPTSIADHIPSAGNDIPDYTDEYKDVLKSIYQNGGFYVGRYETGVQGTENSTESARATSGDTIHTAVIKENVQPYNYLTWGQAQSLAQGISSGGKTSSLLIGVQWDLILKFIGKNGDENSTDWGNYCNSVFSLKQGSHYIKYTNTLDTVWYEYNQDLQGYVVSSGKKSLSWGGIICTTGANTDNNSIKNICDIAGNLSEWTIEKTEMSECPCRRRGGAFHFKGYGCPASGLSEYSDIYDIEAQQNTSIWCYVNTRISCYNLLKN